MGTSLSRVTNRGVTFERIILCPARCRFVSDHMLERKDQDGTFRRGLERMILQHLFKVIPTTMDATSSLHAIRISSNASSQMHGDRWMLPDVG